MPTRTLTGWCLAVSLCLAGCGTGSTPEQSPSPAASEGPAPGSPEAAAEKDAPMLTVQKEPFGTTPEGDEITLYTLHAGGLVGYEQSSAENRTPISPTVQQAVISNSTDSMRSGSIEAQLTLTKGACARFEWAWM